VRAQLRKALELDGALSPIDGALDGIRLRPAPPQVVALKLGDGEFVGRADGHGVGDR
jgi:hypothetical protein